MLTHLQSEKTMQILWRIASLLGSGRPFSRTAYVWAGCPL